MRRANPLTAPACTIDRAAYLEAHGVHVAPARRDPVPPRARLRPARRRRRGAPRRARAQRADGLLPRRHRGRPTMPGPAPLGGPTRGLLAGRRQGRDGADRARPRRRSRRAVRRSLRPLDAAVGPPPGRLRPGDAVHPFLRRRAPRPPAGQGPHQHRDRDLLVAPGGRAPGVQPDVQRERARPHRDAPRRQRGGAATGVGRARSHRPRARPRPADAAPLGAATTTKPSCWPGSDSSMPRSTRTGA